MADISESVEIDVSASSLKAAAAAARDLDEALTSITAKNAALAKLTLRKQIGDQQAAARAARSEATSQAGLVRLRTVEARKELALIQAQTGELRRQDRLRANRGSFAGIRKDTRGPALPRFEVGGIGGVINSAVGNVASNVASSLKDAAIAAVQLVGAGARAVASSAAFRQDTERAFGVLLKSAGAGKAAYQEGLRLANELGQNGRETLGGLNNLLARGFDMEGATGALNVLRAMSDLKVIAPQANIDAMITAIAQIKSKGKLQLEELQGQLGESFDVGAVLAQLSKKLGKSQDEIRKLISAGKIDGETGVLAVLDAIREKTGKDLGGAAKDASRGFSGLFARLQNFPENFLLGLDVSPGMAKVAAFLNGVLDLLDPTTVRGQRAAKAIERIALAVGDLVSSPTTIAAVGTALDMVLAGVEGFMSGLAAAKPAIDLFLGGLAAMLGTGDGGAGTMRLLGQAAGIAAAGFVALGSAVLAPLTGMVTLFRLTSKAINDLQFIAEQARAKGGAIGTALVEGIVAGLMAALPSVVSASIGLIQAAEAGARSAGLIASPSRLFARLGGYLGQGLARGMTGSSSMVGAAGVGLIRAATANDNGVASGFLSRGGAGTASASGAVTINVMIDGATLAAAGVSPEQARATGEAIGDAVIDRWMRRMGERAA